MAPIPRSPRPSSVLRRWLLLGGVVLLGSLALAWLMPLGGGPGLPGVIPTKLEAPRRTPTPTPPLAPGQPSATPGPTPTPASPWWGWLTGGFGEEQGPTSTPTTYFIYLAPVNYDVRPFGPVLTQVPPPPPAPPLVNWPPGRTSLTGSKLSIHVVMNNDPYIMEFIRRVRPRVVKAVDDVGWLTDVKKVSPNTITIGRFMDQDETMVDTMDPILAAEKYVDDLLPRMRLNPGVDFWEGWNEFEPVDLHRMNWYTQFEARRVCYMQEKGLRGAVGGFSTGVPEYEEMENFVFALEATRRCGGLFTLHEYTSPTFACGTTTGREGIIPGAPLIEGPLVGALSLRYRIWYEALLKPRGLGDVPLVISELGVAGILTNQGCDDPGGVAWRDYQDWWVKNGYGTGGAEGYVNVLAWYDERMREDDYVLGATIFTAGSREFDSGWFPFDIHDVMVPLAYYAAPID